MLFSDCNTLKDLLKYTWMQIYDNATWLRIITKLKITSQAYMEVWNQTAQLLSTQHQHIML